MKKIKKRTYKEKTLFKVIPDENKCFQSKKTGYKFIHTKTGKGLPLFIKNEQYIDLYDEVNIPEEVINE